jgi:hypothetical protein
VAGREEDTVTGDDHLADRSVDPAQADLRAGDADRQAVADRLRQALDEGRLTVLEYDERLAAAYQAQTYGELAKVTSDLPARAPSPSVAPTGPSTQPGQDERRDSTKAHVVHQVRGWLGGAVLTNGIWAATSGLDWHHYWPGVVMGIWAAAIAGGAISGRHTRTGHSGLTGRADRHGHRVRSDRHQGRLDREQRRLEQRREPEDG